MKKTLKLLVLFPLLVLMVVFNGCSDDDNGTDPGVNPLIGTWELTTVKGQFQGFLLTIPAATAGVSATIITNADGTYSATWNLAGEVATDDGQWYSDETNITMVTLVDSQPVTTIWPFELADNNNTLITTVEAEDLGAPATLGLQGTYELSFARQ